MCARVDDSSLVWGLNLGLSVILQAPGQSQGYAGVASQSVGGTASRGMGRRRKATKKIAKKSRNVVAVLFKCPFCNTEDSVEVRDARSPRAISTATRTMTGARSCATTARSRKWIGPRQQGVSSAAYAERATRRRSIVGQPICCARARGVCAAASSDDLARPLPAPCLPADLSEPIDLFCEWVDACELEDEEQRANPDAAAT